MFYCLDSGGCHLPAECPRPISDVTAVEWNGASEDRVDRRTRCSYDLGDAQETWVWDPQG